MWEIHETQYRYFLQEDTSTKTEMKIQRFREMPQGWHYGEGAAFAEVTIAKAIALHSAAVDLRFTENRCLPRPQCGYYGNHILV